MKTSTNKMLVLLGLKIQGDLGAITCYTSKRNQVVWYVKAPPQEPPSEEQIIQRNKFRAIAIAWWALTSSQREIWKATQDAGHLRITGYNLFSYWTLSGDDAAIQTVARQSGLSLPP